MSIFSTILANNDDDDSDDDYDDCSDENYSSTHKTTATLFRYLDFGPLVSRNKSIQYEVRPVFPLSYSSILPNAN